MGKSRTISTRTRIRRALTLTWQRRSDFVSALCLLPMVAIQLRRHGYRATSARLDAMASRREVSAAGPNATDYAIDVGFAVRLAARLIPDASCLRKTLVQHYLLAKAGVASDVRLGARPHTDSGGYDFHAWLEVDRTVVSERAETVASYVLLNDHPPADFL